VAVVDSGANFSRLPAHGRRAARVDSRFQNTRPVPAASFRRETRVIEDGVQLKQSYYALTLDGVLPHAVGSRWSKGES